VHACDSRQHAIELLRQLRDAPPLALVDLGLPPAPHTPDEGFQLIADLLAHSPSMKIFVLSGQNDAANARHARALGAWEFVAKPSDPALLRRLLARALELPAAEAPELVGASPVLAKLKQQIAQFAGSPYPVLIEGESGSGKELVARNLHRLSPRSGRPYLTLNCAAISPTLVEPTLFGYVKGAFTGAASNKAGYFEDAQDGTLLLDEIGELPLELQAKLLRVLENGEYQRVGETQRRVSRCRVIAATNRDLRRDVKQGAFRADLYHRLSVFSLNVPPLREMEGDKLQLLEHFRRFYAAQSGMQPFELDDNATALGAVRLSRQRARAAQRRDPAHHEVFRAARVRGGARARARPRGPLSWIRRRRRRDRRAGRASAGAIGGFQPRRNAARLGAGLHRGGAAPDARQRQPGGEAAGREPHHAL